MRRKRAKRGVKIVDLEEKVKKITEILDSIYPNPQIPLDHRDPFTFLVAVVLSAQTTDKKVNQVTPALFARASTPELMAAMDVKEIEGLIRQIGLAPTKARNLKALSQMLVDRFNGQVPQTFEELESLPGVGHKTASVLMVQAFHKPAMPVDTHIHRLATRWGLTSGKNVKQTEADIKRLFPQEQWHRLHLQLITFGREYCPALRHDPTTCPICSFAAVERADV
jgi:endonuclease-3